MVVGCVWSGRPRWLATALSRSRRPQTLGARLSGTMTKAPNRSPYQEEAVAGMTPVKHTVRINDVLA